MKTWANIDDAYGVSAGQAPAGWFAVVLTRPDRDRDFVEHLSERNPHDGATLKPGTTDEQWSVVGDYPRWRSDQYGLLPAQLTPALFQGGGAKIVCFYGLVDR